ncbi:MAG TPA: TIGR03084 family metal-binding protein [Streptosporangiaceae bacterium]|nr:TIGR03084 family metal-binding protein [Streptosporangiaceae bacterium]
MPADLGNLLDDLAAETEALREILDSLTDRDWSLPTPAPGWTIGDQVSHLAYFDDAATMSATDPDRFAAELARAADADPDGIARRYHDLTPAELAAWFGRARRDLLAACAGLDPASRVPWFGPQMSVASSVTARLMETWAHGQDIADTVGVRRVPTHRLRHVAHIGVGARAFSYAANRIPMPADPVRVELVAPAGELWTWGPADARDRVTGPAIDFCLLVTQRRHRQDVTVKAAGPVASEWLTIAQAFAGPPGPGREPGQFASPASDLTAVDVQDLAGDERG